MTPEQLLNALKVLHKHLSVETRRKLNRHVSLPDLIADRWVTAQNYGFGDGSSCYDNVLIKGDVRVGENTWIGPNCILDGDGGLSIGDYCSISAGVQIYTHHTVRWSTSFGQDPEDKAPVSIGSGVYIGPQSVIQMGVTIGDKAVIGAMSFVNCDVRAGDRVWGCPARPAE